MLYTNGTFIPDRACPEPLIPTQGEAKRRGRENEGNGGKNFEKSGTAGVACTISDVVIVGAPLPASRYKKKNIVSLIMPIFRKEVGRPDLRIQSMITS